MGGDVHIRLASALHSWAANPEPRCGNNRITAAHLADVEDLPRTAECCGGQLLGRAVLAARQIEAGEGEVGFPDLE